MPTRVDDLFDEVPAAPVAQDEISTPLATGGADGMQRGRHGSITDQQKQRHPAEFITASFGGDDSTTSSADDTGGNRSTTRRVMGSGRLSVDSNGGVAGNDGVARSPRPSRLLPTTNRHGSLLGHSGTHVVASAVHHRGGLGDDGSSNMLSVHNNNSFNMNGSGFISHRTIPSNPGSHMIEGSGRSDQEYHASELAGVEPGSNATKGRGLSSAMLRKVIMAYDAACSQFRIRNALEVVHALASSSMIHDSRQSLASASITSAATHGVSIDDIANAILDEITAVPVDHLARHCVELHLIFSKLEEMARNPRHVMLQAMQSMASLSPQAVQPVQTTNNLRKEMDADGSKVINGYVVLDELGRGACGKVKLAFDSKGGKMVAIKIVRRVETSAKAGGQSHAQMQFQSLQREIAVMKKLRHKNIVSLYEVIDDPEANKLYLVMQYVDSGPITTFSNGHCTPIESSLLMRYAKNIFAGLMYLHAHNIIHRDIKLENILVSKERVAYLADFGVSEMFALNRGGIDGDAEIQGKRGTLLYMAPELLEHGQSSSGRAVDIWACGVTLYAALTGKLPFETLQDILNARATLVIPTMYGKKWEHLLKGLLSIRPEDRLTAVQAHVEVSHMIRDEERAKRGSERNKKEPTSITIKIEDNELDSAFTPVTSKMDDMLEEGHFTRNMLLGKGSEQLTYEEDEYGYEWGTGDDEEEEDEELVPTYDILSGNHDELFHADSGTQEPHPPSMKPGITGSSPRNQHITSSMDNTFSEVKGQLSETVPPNQMLSIAMTNPAHKPVSLGSATDASTTAAAISGVDGRHSSNDGTEFVSLPSKETTAPLHMLQPRPPLDDDPALFVPEDAGVTTSGIHDESENSSNPCSLSYPGANQKRMCESSADSSTSAPVLTKRKSAARVREKMQTIVASRADEDHSAPLK